MRLHQLGCSVTLIDGPLAGLPKPVPDVVDRVRSPIDLAARMAACAWGVTGGGGAMLEMMALGKPVHVLPRTEFENALARLVLAKDGLVGIGLESLSLPRADAAVRISASARRLVDGLGVERIVNAVEALC